MKTIICKCFFRERKYIKKETKVIRYINDDLRCSSDDSDVSVEE